MGMDIMTGVVAILALAAILYLFYILLGGEER